MATITEQVGKNGKLYRLVDDANPNYDYHDYSVEERHYADGCYVWKRVSACTCDLDEASRMMNEFLK